MSAHAIIRAGETHSRYAFSSVLNATHPLWHYWRAAEGYFVVESGGRPIRAVVASGGMKNAFANWVHACLPMEEGAIADATTTVLVVGVNPGDAT